MIKICSQSIIVSKEFLNFIDKFIKDGLFEYDLIDAVNDIAESSESIS